ncbi:50S ribosomal protein L1p [Candidatus Mancarchaeum acidiphilum]|uniref:Ribosomal protein n=1 Tax=Candidatus Mancarchaeum acidiphilum TaxID=1920749 RepID=A0A218NNJ2_9ARCH|nr:50S ribosomal protein L1 [Candidatus Mancarchaeum acidiphilum]ASI14050.1 50S ribosomal protein L1p [Candidatus Mancarchaeum acidiphilum]
MEKDMKDKIATLLEENKGKRKFTQSVEAAVNFRNVDFTKNVNRLNIEIKLRNGTGKVNKVAVFADDPSIADKAKELGATIISKSELTSVAGDKSRMNELLSYNLLAQPNLMPDIAKALGQFLGPKNKMPRPLIGLDVAEVIKGSGNSIFIRSKGKYLPTINCLIGNEKMSADQIAENVDSVVDALAKKVGKQNIKSIYVKLTMSKPVRLL